MFIPFKSSFKSCLNCSKNLLSSPVDKVTTGTYNFVSFASNVAFVGSLTAATAGSVSLIALLVITQFLHQIKIRFISFRS